MSKKRAKSGAGSAGVSRWESGILQTQFEDEAWKASIAFVVGHRVEDKENLSILTDAVSSGLRKLFTIVSRESLMHDVHDLGNTKAKKPKDVPLYSEICEVAKSHLDQGEAIPLPLLAKLIKWKLLGIRQVDVKRREDEQKAADGKGKGKDGGGGKRPRSKSPAKGKGKNKSPEIPSPKKESKLKKRGEEDQENKFIDDEPDDGPQHYIILQGFDQAPLLLLLGDVGIFVDSIIRLQSQDYARFEKKADDEEEEEEDEKPPEVSVAAEKAKREKEIANLEKFWEQHEPFLKKASKGSRLHHVARLTYTVKDQIIPADLQDNEHRTDYGTALFEDVACMMYDLLDSKRQYQNYLDNMKLIQVPLVGAQPTSASDAQSAVSVTAGLATQPPTDAVPEGKVQPAEVDSRYYNEMMDCVPHESVSVPLIMHCMLEQIAATEDEKAPPSEIAATPRDDGLEYSLAMHIEKMSTKLNSTNSTGASGETGTKDAANSALNKPHFYHYGDTLARRLHHLTPMNGFNPLEAELAMMDYIPDAKLREFPRPTADISKERAARLHELLHFCTSGSVDQAEFGHAFKQFVFESLALRETDEDGLVLDGEAAAESSVVWDDPYPLFKKPEETATHCLPGVEESKSDPALGPSSSQLGILKTTSRQGSAASVRSSRSIDLEIFVDDDDVHFEKDASGQPIIPDKDVPQQGDLKADDSGNNLGLPAGKPQRPGSASSQIGVQDVADKQFRNLDDWKFAEHFQPSVLIQVLEEARQVYPYMDTYYHKRDHSLLVVMHNPVGPNLQNYEPWDAKLHSDVGFRNYMEHVSTIPAVSDWIEEEELQYQAEVARKEMEAMRLAAASPAPAASRPSSSKSKSGKRSASPKKSKSKSPKGRRSASPTVSVDNLDPNSKNFMRPNSMKQWKLENDKLKEEEERKRQEKEKKGRPKSRSRSRSASPTKGDKKDEKKEKRPKSGRGSRNGKEEKVEESKPVEEVPAEEPKEPERIYPFTGYDVGNDLIHGSGSTSTMFPCDGGQIRTEKMQIINGPAFVKTSVLKDGHMFVVHIIDPREPCEEDENDASVADGEDKESVTEKADQEKPEKEDKEVLNDGVSDGRGSAASGDVSIQIASDGRPASAAESDALLSASRDGESPVKGMSMGPNETNTPEPAKKKEKALNLFGSFTAALNDGVMLSFSNYGNEGKSPAADEKVDVDIYVPPPSSPSPPPQASSPSGKRGGSGKKGKKQQQQQQAAEQEKLAQQQLEQQQKEEEERQKKLQEEMNKSKEPDIPPFQQLYISCPDGLHVNYLNENMTGVESESDNCANQLLVRQSYPYKTDGKQQCESSRQTPAMEELSRLITCDGTVIKTMKDGSTQVLFADGVVSCNTGGTTSNMASHSREPSPQRGGSALSMAQGSEIAAAKKGHGKDKKKGGKGSKGKGKHRKNSNIDDLPTPKSKAKTTDKSDDLPTLEVTSDEPDKGWVTTALDGTRIATKCDGTLEEVKPCMLFSAKDPVTAEVMTTREDRVVIVERPDGTRIVDHNEGTRITTYYTQVEIHDDEQEETGETTPGNTREVKQVKVECLGFATVIFNCEDSIATTIFGNGTQVISIPDGTYEVLHNEGSRLHVDVQGAALYTPKQEQEAQYTMRHKQAVIFEMVDKNGNLFSVKNTGDVQVLRGLDMDEGKIDGGEGEEKGEKEESNHHAPRFFVIHDDGSGMELLRMKDIREYLEIADRDPTTAILSDAIPDHPNIKGINILRPYTAPLSQSWLIQFDENNIIPAHLRSRDFSKLPPYEAKQPGPNFGTNVGRGLAVGSVRKPLRRGPIPSCPNQLELRQFTEYKSMSKELRERMRVGLEAYAKEAEKKQKTWMNNALKDPRSEEEKAGAGELLAHILAQEEDTVPNPEDGTAPDGTAMTEGAPLTNGMATDGVLPTDTTAGGGDAALAPTPKPKDIAGCDDVKALYENATAPPPLPAAPKPKNKYTDNDWERVRRDLEEEQACRKALKNREVPNYFDSEWGKSFLLSLSAGPDMDALTKSLAVETRKGEGEGNNQSLPSTPAETPVSARNASGEGNQSGTDSTSPQKQCHLAASREGVEVTPTQGISPSDVRPLNPTPGHAQGKGTPTALRPTNPTPAHAALQTGTAPSRPGNPTPGGVTDNTSGPSMLPSETPSSYASFPNHPSTIPEQTEEGLTERTNTAQSEQANGEPNSDGYGDIPSSQSDAAFTKSLVTDVNGLPRKDTVRLPAAILGSRPGAVANDRFQTLEDPVRRKTLNSSIAGAEAKGIAPLSTMRGFELVPGEVHFGTLREGCTYAFTVHLKNVGIDGCRYKVKQPPPATGLQVIYKPGPIAAGMKAQLELQLYAIAVGVKGQGSGQGSIGHHIEIVTENEMLYLQVSASIMTAYEYDECCRNKGKPPMSAGVRLVSNRPPSREGIIRPRKDIKDSKLGMDSQPVQ